jgi:hypothetical protein
VLLLFVGAYYGLQGQGNYRYVAEALSESDSSFSIIMIVLNLIVTLDLFYCMFVRRNDVALPRRRYVENVLMSLVLILTANGTGGMLVGLVSLAYSLAPVRFARLLFAPATRRKRARRTLVVGVLGITCFGFAWIAGETIKISAGLGQDLTAAWHTFVELTDVSTMVETYGYYLITAISSYYYTLLFTANAGAEALTGGAFSALMHPLQSFLFRLDYVTGGLLGVARPEFGSLSRLNYTLLSAQPVLSLREGSSPGLLGSFNYVFVFPLNVIFAALYMRWLARLTNRLLQAHRHESISIFGLLLLTFYMLIFFQSPFDWLAVFDNAVIYVLLVMGIALAQPHADTIPVASRRGPAMPPLRPIAGGASAV